MRAWFATMAVAFTLSPAVTLADHMNGEFFGTGEWADFTLYLSQSGRVIEADILQCDEPVIELDGQSDGGDLAQGEAFALGNGAEGTFMLRWSQGNVLIDMAFAGTAYQAAFGHHPTANSCGAQPDGGRGGRSDTHGHGPGDHSHDGAAGNQAEGGGDGATDAQGENPFPDY